MISFGSGDPRVRRLNDRPTNPRGEFVLYWSQVYRRGDDNAALAYAVEQANELGLPCVVYEALRPDYPYASDRLHTFVLEGARDTAAALEARGIAHAFFLPRTADEARGVVAKLSARAAMIVSDEFPTYIVPAQNAAAAERAACAYVTIDDCVVAPMSLFPKQEHAARTLRPKIHRALETWLAPIEEPEPRVAKQARLDLPFSPVELATADIAALVAACEIDHDVPAVAELPGGSKAAHERLARFVARKLSSYATDRNDPSRDGASHLSPYLHFGMVSARRVALTVKAWVDDGGAADAAEPFLEQLLVRRALAFNFAHSNSDHATYAAMPAWARESLAARAGERGEYALTIEQLADARSPDPIWNAAQLELRARGVIHGYARMLWGKLVLSWFPDPAKAFAILVELNDRYALDGRDPDGYANIGWCFGLHDRPWPNRPKFGTVRTMTTKSAANKLDFDAYLDRSRAWRDLTGL